MHPRSPTYRAPATREMETSINLTKALDQMACAVAQCHLGSVSSDEPQKATLTDTCGEDEGVTAVTPPTADAADAADAAVECSGNITEDLVGLGPKPFEES